MLYFDNAATTKISKSALNAYIQASEIFYNPSSLYAPAMQSKQIVEQTREFILKTFKAKENSTLIFTSGATEANNAVLFSTITRKDKKYIFSAGEHSSIYETAKKYKEQGFNIEFVPLKKDGCIDEKLLYQSLDDTVALVSIIYVSNETGAVNDIKTITQNIKSKFPNIIIHTDGVQAVGKFDINLKELGVDYFTMSAHKIHGPKGIGALYIANSNRFKAFITGGGQEFNLRSGTENVPAICAYKQAVQDLKINDYTEFKKIILDSLEGDYIVVSNENCVNNIISVCFKGVRGETIQHMLEEKGFLIGTGSACNSKAKQNRVISLLVDRDYVEGAIRISFGDDVTLEDCKNVAIELSKAVKDYKNKVRK